MAKKGGIDLTHSLIIFLILNIIFFAALFIFVARAGSQAAIYEQLYTKQIALLIDSAKPGTNFTLDLSDAYKIARQNKYLGKDLVKIDPETKEIIVKLTGEGSGYSFKHFNDAIILWEENSHYGKLYVHVLKRIEEKQNEDIGE